MRLLLARHGATSNNAQHRYTGQSDIPMSALGERQAEALANRLASRHLDGVVSSDLQRASRMAQPIADQHHVPLQLDSDLREISMGTWEGASFEEIRAREPDMLLRSRDDPFTFAPPGGETIVQVRDRLVIALARSYAAFPDGTVLWVTHGGCIGILFCHLLGVDLARRWQFRKDNAALSEIAVERPRAGSEDAESFSTSTIALYFNDTCHLDSVAGAEAKERFQVL